jgi:coenzyme F420-0:L-glutamate ligase
LPLLTDEKGMRIEFIGLRTEIITIEDRYPFNILLEALKENKVELLNKDVLIIASKIISTIEGCRIKLSDIVDIRQEAIEAADKSRLDPRFVEIVFQQADEIIGAVPGAVLALKDGVLQANAGVDQSNSGGDDFLITLPKDPIGTAEKLRLEIKEKINKDVGVIIADSKTHPLRRGTSGFALGVSGFNPIIDDRGSKDIFNRIMHITTRAIADNLVCGAEILMGESSQRIPIVIARGYTEIPFRNIKDIYDSNNQMKMDPSHCIYMGPFWNKI